MILWAIFGLMTVVALALLLPPLLRRQREAAAGASHDVEVYRHQLSELERDQERGLLTPAEAKAARTEIGRRLLRAADDAAGAESTADMDEDERIIGGVILAGTYGGYGSTIVIDRHPQHGHAAGAQLLMEPLQARHLGAAGAASPGAEAVEAVMSLSEGLGADAVFDTVGGATPRR